MHSEAVAPPAQVEPACTKELRIRMGQCTKCGEMPDRCCCKQAVETPIEEGDMEEVIQSEAVEPGARGMTEK